MKSYIYNLFLKAEGMRVMFPIIRNITMIVICGSCSSGQRGIQTSWSRSHARTALQKGTVSSPKLPVGRVTSIGEHVRELGRVESAMMRIVSDKLSETRRPILASIAKQQGVHG